MTSAAQGYAGPVWTATLPGMGGCIRRCRGNPSTSTNLNVSHGFGKIVKSEHIQTKNGGMVVMNKQKATFLMYLCTYGEVIAGFEDLSNMN